MTKPAKTKAQAPAKRLAWERPTVRRMSAGSAETGSTVQTDLGVTFS